MSSSLSNFISKLLVQWKMLLIKQFVWKPFLNKCRTPQKTQNELLIHIINSNKDSRFGKEHNFVSINSYEDYCKKFPLQTFEELRPYIEQQEKEKEPSLTIDQPVLYSQTSGTTGKPKYIPIIKKSISNYKSSQEFYSFFLYDSVPHIYQGKVLVIGSPVIEGYLESGSPYGSMSGLICQSMPDVLREKYVVPWEVFEIEDYQLKYLLISAYALKEKDITFIASANPTTFVKIIDTIRNNSELLLSFLKTGDISLLTTADRSQNIILKTSFKADESRVDELAKLSNSQVDVTFADLWPNLKAVATWTGGNCSIYIPKLKPLFPINTRIIEMGYIASEFRGGLTINAESGDCVPTINENFFEFVELDEWGHENPNILTLDKVETGKQYYVIVTTLSGLYRYFINDIVEISGKFKNTPTLRFIQKGKGITNLIGEKLSENQVIEAVKGTCLEIGEEGEFFIMLADTAQTNYTLYIECPPINNFDERFEKNLSAKNIEFEAKRNSGRLLPTQVRFLNNGCAEEYKEYQIKNGQRESQYKLVRLQYDTDCKFDFSYFENKKK
ncbi:MAG: GH3 auxin-responsive promoter family protein [Nitrospinales bacterium]